MDYTWPIWLRSAEVQPVGGFEVDVLQLSEHQDWTKYFGHSENRRENLLNGNMGVG